MPSGPLIATRLIVNTVLELRATRVLDLGMGTGKYGFLLREQSDFAQGRLSRDDWRLTIDGVEGYEAYVGDHQRSVYDQIVIADVRDFLRDRAGDPYDVALALDIVEHFPPDAAADFVSDALDAATYVIVSTPKGFYPQIDEPNELERHHSWWPRKGLRSLAERCDARASITQVRMVNLAVLSRRAEPPSFVTERRYEVSSFLKDRLLPELPYYRLIGKAGPTIGS
jgi:hypothetical protein